jgi:3-deoxy-manno-octulosonate cytidylyltransferase (CMP-KDO synthetase)
MTEFAVTIPARFASERLPGKPLRDAAGKPLLQHVWERAKESGAREVVIATDDARIESAAKAFGAEVCMTSADHQSGTDRIAEVAEQLGWSDDKIVVNLQGDEPLMPAALIAQCAGLLDDKKADLATLASPMASRKYFVDPNVVKVVVDDFGFALYFSRAPIPFSRDPDTDALAVQSALHHHGLYAYRCDVLRRIVAASPSAPERCEKLEQLRAMSLGLAIKVGVPDMRPGPGVDTEDDLAAVSQILLSKE